MGTTTAPGAEASPRPGAQVEGLPPLSPAGTAVALLFDRPDWLREPAASDVSPAMFWMPVVTFWQVTADLPFALQAPPGHGHHYREIFADAWAAVAAPPGWDEEDTQRLRARLATPGE